MESILKRLRLGRNQIIWLVLGLVFVIYGLVTRGPLVFFSTIVALIMGITVHECSHAWMANYLGDPTARLRGRISLNPLRHLDPLGTAMMAVTMVTGIGIGWGKPTPVAPHRLRYGQRLGSALVGLAGPVSNILVAVVVGIWLRLGRLLPSALAQVLLIIAITNAFLAAFNLLPLPPLDGFSVLVGLISLVKARWAWIVVNKLENLARYGPMLFIGLILVTQFFRLNILGVLIGYPASVLMQLITGIKLL